MRAVSVPVQKQCQLIMECRASGLSDHQWCMEHNIKPGTFYNWVRRLRKSGYPDLPAAARCRKPDPQEIVRLEFGQPDGCGNQMPGPNTVPGMHGNYCAETKAVLELVISGNTIRIPNGTDPQLLGKTLRLLKELSC